MVLSKDNQYIKLAKSLHDKKSREQEGLFLLEGKTLIEEAIKKQIQLQTVFVLDESITSQLTLDDTVKVFEIEKELMERICTTENPPPILAIAELPQADLKNKSSSSGTFLYLENISDPGNLGSIIRTAFAAGVQSIFLSPGSVDIYNTKVLRSSMGTVFYGPIKYIALETLINQLKQEVESLEILGTCPRNGVDYSELHFNPLKSILVLVGNETRGLSEEAQDLCTQLVQIPLANDVESLNILAATSVILFGLKPQAAKLWK